MKLLAALGVAVLAIGLVCRFFLQVRPVVTSSSAKQSLRLQAGEKSASTATKLGPASTARPSPDPIDDRPFVEVRSELERRAAAGAGRAATRLGMVLANCNRYVPISNEQIESWVVDAAAMGASIREGERKLSPDAVLARSKLGSAQKAHDCKNVSGLNENDASAKALQWIERGAALGDADAQALYGALAFSSYDARTALVDAEDVRERKQRAVGYLQQSIAQGDALALRQMATHYAVGDLYPASSENAYAYWYAYSLTSRASDIVPELLEQMLAASAESLDGETRQRARNEGTRIAACCGIDGQKGP